MLPFLAQRIHGYSLLSGKGIEIGAFEHPAPLPPTCKVEYCDAITPEQAQALFPEIDTSKFVKINHIIDLNQDGLSKFPDGTFDFVIFNHVVEHLVNPIYIVSEVLRVLKTGGKMVIAAPDKDYTFDKARPLTPFDHVKSDYLSNAKEAAPEDYYDIIPYIHSHLVGAPQQQIQEALNAFKSRREHLHVWDSTTFRAFLTDTFNLLKVKACPLYEVAGHANHFEYFGVWEKNKRPSQTTGSLKSRILRKIHTGKGIMQAVAVKSKKLFAEKGA